MLFRSPVVMLSKLRYVKDFEMIEKIAERHDGAWFNRISRIEESRDPAAWRWDYGLETTPLETDVFIRELSKKISFVFLRPTYCS